MGGREMDGQVSDLIRTLYSIARADVIRADILPWGPSMEKDPQTGRVYRPIEPTRPIIEPSPAPLPPGRAVRPDDDEEV